MDQSVVLSIPTWLFLPLVILGYLSIILSITQIVLRYKIKKLDLEITSVSTRMLDMLNEREKLDANKKSKARQSK